MSTSGLQLWGGVECTINRVHDQQFDQIARSGHQHRLSDLDLIADLGIRTLRYPVLWEKHWPDPQSSPDFSWSDERLGRLRELGITPIVGLVHHGSGPMDTNLLDPEFPYKCAAYARKVAERYPWIEYYTPINEPLTTARFSGLYGHWYPHGQDERTFSRCLFTELKAVVLAMRAIREVNPNAKLVQTEDLAKVFCTPPLQYQADYENERRWVSFDLLTGRLLRPMRMYQHFVDWLKLPAADVEWFAENPCPPDIMGVNYYVTSERYLDHRIDCYTRDAWATNDRQTYADVAAVHVRSHGIAGLSKLLFESWQRYRMPMAVTEAHLGCTREEQMRWLMEIWNEGLHARHLGIDLRAITLWCMFGAYNWNTLVTREEHYYEPGVFDIRSPKPRPTALARMARQLTSSESAKHVVFATPGWWRRPARHHYKIIYDDHNESGLNQTASCEQHEERPILITGARGNLAQELIRQCRQRGLSVLALDHHAFDVACPFTAKRILDAHRPWAIINTAAMTDIDEAERRPECARRINTMGAAILAELCASSGVRLVTLSSEHVFDGCNASPYVEHDVPAPRNILGRTKADAESLVLQVAPHALIIRTSALYGPRDSANFLTRALETLAAGGTIDAPNDLIISPTYIPDLATNLLDLLLDEASGVWHLANTGQLHYADFIKEAAALASLDPAKVRAVHSADLQRAAPRPANSALASERHTLMPSRIDALARYICARSHAAPSATPTPQSLSRVA